MTNDQIEQVASKIVAKHLQSFGFKGVDVKSEIDFDGSPIIRIRARYTDDKAPTSAITQSLHDIRNELLRLGDERFVILEGDYLGAEPVDEDVN